MSDDASLWHPKVHFYTNHDSIIAEMKCWLRKVKFLETSSDKTLVTRLLLLM